MSNYQKQVDAEFNKLLRKLRKEMPCALPVFVRRAYEPDDGYGRTYLRTNERSYQIVISTHIRDEITERVRRVTYNELVDSLIHEWAHAVTYTKKHHSRKWGSTYAETYCAAIGEDQ